jgi:type I restriction enzyme M protein
MSNVKANEREFMSLVVSWLNEFFRTGSYPFEMASSDPSVKISEKKTKFPDIQIWLNRQAEQGFCGWELKTPETAVDDNELLEDAAEKARAMKANYFVTWNMRDAAIWRTPHWGECVSRVHRLKTYESLYNIAQADDLKVALYREALEERAREILDDLATLHREGHLHLVDIDSTFFVHILSEGVKNLWPHIYQSLSDRVGRDSAFRSDLYNWAAKQGIANFEEASFLESVSRQIVYRLVGRILFYLTLRRFRTGVEKMNLVGIDPSRISQELKRYFQIAQDIDYQAVFEEDFPDRVEIPASAAETLIKLVDDLNRFDFARMPQDVVGQVFEQLIPYEERHALGQYFTREDLVDFINAFCIRSREDKVLDPTCGTGTFLLRAYDRLKYLGERDHKKLLSKLWGIDIAHFPAELATINLYRQNLDDYANFPRIVVSDFFEIKPGQIFKFPPPRPTDNQFMIEEPLPVFDGIVGNFPYIRQEIIEKRIEGYKKTLARVLAEDWLEEYPEAFEMSKKIAEYLQQAKRRSLKLTSFYDKIDLKLSGQADIYAFLFFHAARFLREGGRMGIVTSSAWLETEYGYELQKFFLQHFKIVAVLMSMSENWFEDVPVITSVTVLERCSQEEQRNDHLVKFVKVKKKLKELIPWDLKLEAHKRWAGIEKLVHKIESTGSEYLQIQGTKAVNTLRGVATYEDDNFRIRAVKQGELLEKLEHERKTARWGQFLRAPDIYFEILEKCKNKLVPLSKVADLRRGITTGINEFFYLTDEKIRHWEIEPEFLRPIVTSLKEVEGILIDPAALKFKVLLCDKSKAELLREGKHGVLEYIKWGEKQKTKERGRYKRGGIPFPQVPSVQGRKYWYSVDAGDPSDFLINRFIRERFFFPVNKAGVLAGDVVFEGQVLNKKDAEFYAAILNSTLVFFLVELLGRFSMGDGLLTFYGPDIADLQVPDASKIKADLKKRILKAFDKVLTRPVQSIFEEVKMKDRQKFDCLVLEAIGLDAKRYLKLLYKNLCELVRERIELGETRKKVKKVKQNRDVEKLKEQVLEEILPKGPRRFPEDFIDSKYLKDAFELPVPGEPLKLGAHFMGTQEVISDKGFRYQAQSVEEAKFIVYAVKAGIYLLKVPNNKSALSQAVIKYERYLRQLKDEFFEVFFQRTHDHKLADMLTNQIFEDLGLPEVAA